MFKAFQHLPGAIRSSCTRHYSQQLAATAREGVASTTQQLPSAKLVQYPYYIPRNTRGSLPVYSDIRNNGTRILVQIRNVEGNVEQLAQDVRAALLEKGSPNATRMRVTVKARQLILQGGFWKNDIMEWLISRGF